MTTMLSFQGKPLEQLSMEESIEFEKEILKKLLAADRAGMSQGIIGQLQQYLEIVRAHKKEKIAGYVQSSIKVDGRKENEDGLIIGEDEQVQSDDTESE